MYLLNVGHGKDSNYSGGVYHYPPKINSPLKNKDSPKFYFYCIILKLKLKMVGGDFSPSPPCP